MGQIQVTHDPIESMRGTSVWEVGCKEYPGRVSLEAHPWRGKLGAWLRGVSTPLPNFSPDEPRSWEEFSSMSHYRTTEGVEGIVSMGGIFNDLLDKSTLVPITEEHELRMIYDKQCRESRVTKVSDKDRTIAWYLAADDSPGAMIWFTWAWKPEEQAIEDGRSVKITFKPSRLAQLRHWFSLKPWSITIHAPQPA